MAAAALVVAAAILHSCGTTEPDDLATPLSVTIPLSDVEAPEGSQFIDITAGGPWTAALVFDTDEQWARLKQTSGSGTCRNTIYWDRNVSETPRVVTVRVDCGGQVSTAVLTQAGEKRMTTATLHPDPVPVWLELPSTDDSSRYFFTHDMTLGTARHRNYSFFLDPEAKLSVWVAYPLNKGLISSGGRTDDWSLDPKVPREYQPVIYMGGFRGGYERGHQCPSADRLERNANKATFYGTNMTPQRGELNELAWAALESRVRNWSNSFDTLYVVTGADIRGAKDYAFDNDGKAIPVPVGYFKALLGYKKNASSSSMPGQVRGYVGIGFYFQHHEYSESTIMAQSMTIDELEQKTGFDFFVNLSTKITEQDAATVESTKSTWWK